MPKKSRQKRIDPDVRTEIEEQAIKGTGPAAIERNLKGKPKWVKLGIPHIKTIQAIARENTPKDPSSPWKLADADGQDAALVLPVLAALIEESEGRLNTISNERAEWIIRLSRVAGDLPPWTIYRMAHAYMLRVERQDATDILDGFLAFAPWRDAAAKERYDKAVKAGWTSEPFVVELEAFGVLEIAGEGDIGVKPAKRTRKSRRRGATS